mgnify:CR=1 FL=1
MENMRLNLVQTDIYLDRYLPVSTLNLIKEVCEDSFSKFRDKKCFLQELDGKYQEVLAKIKKEEKIDSKIVNKCEHTCKLRKKGFVIPEIEIPETISDSDSEGNSLEAGVTETDLPSPANRSLRKLES